MASAGVPLSAALGGANAYGFLKSSYSAKTVMDSTFNSIPADNVANITNGYDAQMSGTTCAP